MSQKGQTFLSFVSIYNSNTPSSAQTHPWLLPYLSSHRLLSLPPLATMPIPPPLLSCPSPNPLTNVPLLGDQPPLELNLPQFSPKTTSKSSPLTKPSIMLNLGWFSASTPVPPPLLSSPRSESCSTPANWQTLSKFRPQSEPRSKLAN